MISSDRNLKASKLWWKQNRFLVATLILGGLVRALFLLVFFADLQSDPDAYKQIAVNLRTQGVYGQAFGDGEQDPPLQVQPTAFRPPLYPLVLSAFVTKDVQGKAIVSRTGIACLHFVLGMMTIALAWGIGRNFELPDTHCLTLGLLVAFDPIALRQSGLPMTETLAILFAMLGIWMLSRKTAIGWPVFGVGLLFGLFSLCRPTFLIWAGLLFIAVLVGLIQTDSRRLSQKITFAAIFGVGVFIVLVPWIIRNYQQFGKPIFATSHGGYTIFLGNNDSFYDYLHSGKSATWNGEKELRAIVLEIRQQSLITDQSGVTRIDEVQKDKLYYEKAKEVILRRPGDFLYSCCVRIIRFWSLVPRSTPGGNDAQRGWKQRLIRYGSGAWYLVLFSFALVGLWRLIQFGRKNRSAAMTMLRTFLPSILLVVAFQGLHLLYWSNMRMRAPLVGVIALLAVIGFVGREWMSQKYSNNQKQEK